MTVRRKTSQAEADAARRNRRQLSVGDAERSTARSANDGHALARGPRQPGPGMIVFPAASGPPAVAN